MKENPNNDFIAVRCPRCKAKHRKIGEYRGNPRDENFEAGFWCKDCKKSILIKWHKTCVGYVWTWRVREDK